MTNWRAVVVVAVSVGALVPALVGISLVPTSNSLGAGVSGCGAGSTLAPRFANLTPSNPVLIPQCDRLSSNLSGLRFTVNASVDLRGSYLIVGQVALALDAFAASGQETSYWSCGGPESCSGGNDTFDVVLFPGTYLFYVSARCSLGSCTSGYAVFTEAVAAYFDRAVHTASVPGNLTVASSAYESWSIPVPTNSSDAFLEDGMVTTVCQWKLAVLPLPAFRAFELNPGDFDLPNVTVLETGNVLSCPATYYPTTAGPLWYGPLNLTVESELVFYNSGSSTGYLWSGPLEVSYLLSSPT